VIEAAAAAWAAEVFGMWVDMLVWLGLVSAAVVGAFAAAVLLAGAAR